MVKLTQMKWKGTVSQSGHSHMAMRFATANRPQATLTTTGRCAGQSDRSARCKLVALSAHGLDRLLPQLRPQPADVHVDDVGTRLEVVAPDRRQQPFLRDDDAGALHQLAQQERLALRERDGPVPQLGLAADQ